MPQPDLHPLPGREVIVGVGAGHAAGETHPDAPGSPLRLHVVEHGRRDAAGLPLLMLHGVPATSYVWRDVARDLERDRLSVMPDLVGCGESERPAGRSAYRLEEQATAVLAALDRIGIERFAVLGSDLGGAIAVHLAALAGQRVAALVLAAAPVHELAWPTGPALPLLPRGSGEAVLALLRARPAWGRGIFARGLGAALSERELDRYLAPLRTPEGAAALLRFVRAVDLGPVERAWTALRAVPPPTLVLWGEQDRLRSTAYGRRLPPQMAGAGGGPGGRAGDPLARGGPERVAEEVAGFLAEL